jgi:hypothetical protein
VPALGRFASADTLVPDPTNPQQFNRFSYVLNNPLKYIDPTGHCTNNYDEGSNELTSCLHLINLLEADRYKPLIGENPEEVLEKWRQNADIDALRAILDFYDEQITPTKIYRNASDSAYGVRKHNVCQYWEDCYKPLLCDVKFDYCTFEISAGPVAGGVYVSITKDRYDNWYLGVGLQAGASPGLVGGKVAGGKMVYVNENGEALSFANPSRDDMVRYFSGLGSSGSVGFGIGGGSVFPAVPTGVAFVESGVYSPQAGMSYGLTFHLNP